MSLRFSNVLAIAALAAFVHDQPLSLKVAPAALAVPCAIKAML